MWARLIEAHGATIFAAVPGVYRQLLRSGALETADLSSMRHGVTAGEALQPALLEQWDRDAAAFRDRRRPFLLYD